MAEFLYSIDKSLFYFGNQTLSNPLFDVFMPALTDLNKTWWGLSLYAAAWLLLVWKGGRKGRMVALLLIPVIYSCDQVSSSFIKNLVERARPCHEVDGIPVVEHIRLLVHCGSGYSFPSSHAVNNFGVAAFLSYHYRRWTWAFVLYAAVVGFSRISVGVHYPSDVVGGAIVGSCCAAILIAVWNLLSHRYPSLKPMSDQAGSLEQEIST